MDGERSLPGRARGEAYQYMEKDTTKGEPCLPHRAHPRGRSSLSIDRFRHESYVYWTVIVRTHSAINLRVRNRVSMSRLTALRRALRDQKLDRIIITSPEHVRYLSGFSGSSGWLIVGPQEQVLLTDFRYREQAAEEAPACSVFLAKNGLPAAVREVADRWNRGRVGFESAYLTMREYQSLSAPPSGGEPLLAVEWVPTERLVESLMMVKDADEISKIAKAAEITDRAFAEVLPFVKPGVAEREVAAEFEYRARRLGADRAAFPPIVASGPNAALPHAQPTDRQIADGDMIILDFGASYAGYASDMTRTLAVGSVSDKLRQVYDIVAHAQQAALDAVRPGISGVDLDHVARSYIAEQGFGEAFGHALGHGVGLRVHDVPSISWRSQDTLVEGMVATIEPGVYLPGWGGVRIEDLVVITATGKTILSHTSKALRAL